MNLNANNYHNKGNSTFAFIGSTMNTFRILLEKRFKEDCIDISLNQYIILNIIYNKEKIILEELSKILNKDKSAVLRHIKYLNNMFCIAKMEDQNDKRKKVLILTKFGADLLDKARKIETVLNVEISTDLDNDSLNNFKLVLNTLSDQTQKLLKK